MPSYNTRLRTNSILLPPRRLRHSPSPPPRSPRIPKNNKLHITNTPPLFPPPNVVLHPDDAANKTLIAIGRALLAVDNRAITIKDLSQLTLDCGLLCQNVSAASQAITTFIRNHLSRCHQEHAQPLLLSLALTGTPDDDRLAPALHSRSGGTSSTKDNDHAITSFRRGTTVWYLSELAGAPCPFKRAGLCLDHILGPPHGAKRKRDSPQSHPRKLPAPVPAPSPAIATRTRTRTHPDPPPVAPARLRVKLTVRVPQQDPEPHPDDSDAESSLSETPSSLSDSISISSSSPPSPAPYPTLPPYPILSPSIPSPHCHTPATTFVSPSAPCAAFLPVHTALSNPPRDFRSRSCSLPFSSASPPPDSEDEDHDFHNSMVGLRRGSVPLLKKEHSNSDPATWGTPLEFLPAFDPSPIKPEPTSAILPPPPAHWDDNRWEDRWANDHHDHEESGWNNAKPELSSDEEHTVLDPDNDTPALAGKGTREDPVRIDPVVGDVELLGPESVRSRELDAAWNAAAREPSLAAMDVDRDETCRRQVELRASPAETVETVPTTISSPPSSDELVALDATRDTPFIMHPLRPCDPPIVATVIEGIPVYHTLLAPGLPLLRRIDTALVTISPLLAFLGLPPPARGAWASLTVAQVLAARPGLPSGVRDIFLRADLGAWFPDALAPLVQLHAGALETGIRAEDVFAPRASSAADDAEVALGPSGTSGLVAFDAPAEATVTVLPRTSFDEQEDALFSSFVDYSEPVKPPATTTLTTTATATATAHAKENTASEKENASAGRGRRVREKEALAPVRRSKRAAVVGAVAAAKLAFPVTRARARARARAAQHA